LAKRPVTLVEAVYKAIQVFLEKFGEFLREAAVLVLVFLPLDLWKDQVTWPRAAGVLFVSALLFCWGLGCEFTSIVVKRYRDRYEEEKSQ